MNLLASLLEEKLYLLLTEKVADHWVFLRTMSYSRPNKRKVRRDRGTSSTYHFLRKEYLENSASGNTVLQKVLKQPFTTR